MKSQIRFRFIVAGCLLLGIGACTASPPASPNATAPDAAKVPVVVTDTGCQPTQLTVATGQSTFEITNKSSQILEWEILQDGKVAAEQENIVPGFVQDLKADLKPGQYQMTCGLGSNPKGTIVVN